MINRIKKRKELYILLILIVISSIWVLTKGMPYQHDIDFHFGRLVGLANTLKTGDVFALIHDNFYGYGYATGIFYGNFFFYIPALLILIGIPKLVAFKIFYTLVNVLTIIISYFCFKSITKDKKTSTVATILYSLSNYKIIDTFVRGAVGEMLAFMIIPIIILGLYELVYRDYKKWYLFTIGFVLLLLAHLISTFLIAIFVVIFLICSYKELLKEKERIKYLFLSGLVGLGLGAFFLLPMLEQRINGNIQIFKAGTIFNLKDYAVNFKDFLIPTKIFNTFLGYSLMILLPIRYFIKKNYEYDKKDLKFADIFLVLSIIAWVLTTKIVPWASLQKYLYFVQFPWRLLLVSSTFIVFSYAIYYKVLYQNRKLNKKKKLVKILFRLAIIISIIDIGYYSIQFGVRRNQYKESEMNLNSIGGGEYLIYETEVTKLQAYKEDIDTNIYGIDLTYKKNGTKVDITYSNNNTKDGYIEIPLFNYYGYKVTGGKLVNGDNNLIRVIPNNESGTITVRYGMTTIQKASHIVSFLFLIWITSYIVIEKRNK